MTEKKTETDPSYLMIFLFLFFISSTFGLGMCNALFISYDMTQSIFQQWNEKLLFFIRYFFLNVLNTFNIVYILILMIRLLSIIILKMKIYVNSK